MTDLAIPEAAPVTLFRSDDPQEIVARATATANALARVVKGQKLAVRIGNREHVKVEGWSLLGTMLGVFPVCEWTRPIRTAEGLPHGWEARVEARTRDGAIVGSAEAQCLRDEAPWSWEPVDRDGNPLKPRDDYALRSMAQTRATSKALRLPLGFVMVLAGYDATPAEEMPAEPESAEPKAAAAEVKKALALVETLKAAGVDTDEYAKRLRDRYGTEQFRKLSKGQIADVLAELEGIERDAAIPF